MFNHPVAVELPHHEGMRQGWNQPKWMGLNRVLTRDPGARSMLRSILVPLDLSPFAEPALPPALGIARRAAARLDLVMVHASYFLEEQIPRGISIDPESETERRRQEQACLDATSA